MAVAVGSRREIQWMKIAKNEQIEQWLKRSKSLRILVTGKTGVGKSSLVNGIVGKYVSKEGDSLERQTSTVTEYRTTIMDVEVVIYDSPGLQDGTSHEESYLMDMEEKCKNVDLILYCTQMTEMRVTTDDIEAMKKLTEAFGRERFWKNTLFVLTFANKVMLPPQRGSGAKKPLGEYFDMRLKEWKTKLSEILCNIGIDKEVAENVPVVPAGYHLEPSLPSHDYEYWLSNLWFRCLDRTADVAKPAFLKINWNRLRTLQEVTKEDVSSQEAYNQPIIFRGNINPNIIGLIPPVLLEFLGLPPQPTKAGEVGSLIGRAVGCRVGGTVGMQTGEIAGAILGELVYKYAMEIFQIEIK